jgi:hypothetical protein
MAFRANLHLAESPGHTSAPPASSVRQQCSSKNIAVDCGAIAVPFDRMRACAAAFRAQHEAAAHAYGNNFGKTALPLD